MRRRMAALPDSVIINLMEQEILWTAAFLDERFTEPVSPLGWSFVGSLFEETALRDPLRYMGFPAAETIPATRLWHGRPYVNVEIFQIFYKPFPAAFVPADAVRYFPGGDLSYRRLAPYPPAWYSPRLVASLLWHLARDPLNASPFNFWSWARFAPKHTAEIKRLEARLADARTAQDLLSVVDETYALDRRFLQIHRWSLTYADLFYKLLAHVAGADAQRLISDVPNLTRRVNAELDALARRSPPPSAELLAMRERGEPLNAAQVATLNALDAFLERHGHRSFSLDLAQPTFRDDPTQLLALLNPSTPTSASGEHAPAPPSRRRGVRQLARAPLLAFARRYARLREDQRYHWQKSLALTRRAYLRLGADPGWQRISSRAEDIFYATHAELADYFSARLSADSFAQTVRERRQAWETYRVEARAHRAAAHPPFLRGDQPLGILDASATGAREWQGRGVSPGTARGIARVVLDPHELGRVGVGDILIAPSTDPAWTPVFARIAGLALERGGVLSHAAVVAREYHLPAVAAIRGLTDLIRDGEWIEIDGTSGVVRRLNGTGDKIPE